ncbi:hypothetical protein [Citrobacter amalonaticus]|uniref:hypothetical protein n=1 Tax=Citrobacter amalonaticus TaxID=35703 RepID=UPI0006212643|nr:hypothetical protein [Citrobacter amalonaticus]KKF69370.1 hypothetical protein XU19_14435 [Vibrio parahaemolyticus]KKY41924.1 hypothetical protein AAY51_13255 [Vibrio parahaemolyticus]KOP94712.1 hypothetical protein AL012_13100 [Citrobacter amalonaticus]KOP97568.1 hypothetical protein ALC61_12880 [Citrobacter amalonaticus]
MKDYAWVFGLFGNLLVFIGWIVVYFNAKNISTRSEIKSVVDSIVKTINESSERGMKYWHNKGSEYSNNEHYISMIMSNITLVSQLLIFVKVRGVDIDNDINKFIDSLTLDSDKVTDYESQQCALRANVINSEAMDVITRLMNAFHEKYPPTHYADVHRWYVYLSSF